MIEFFICIILLILCVFIDIKSLIVISLIVLIIYISYYIYELLTNKQINKDLNIEEYIKNGFKKYGSFGAINYLFLLISISLPFLLLMKIFLYI